MTYPGFGTGPLDTVANAARALDEVLDAKSVAIDAGSFPAALAADLEWVDVEKGLTHLRAVKDPDEVERIQEAIAVCDAGQAAARTEARPGITELDLWAVTRAAMETAAGARLPVLADLVSGPRTADVGALRVSACSRTGTSPSATSCRASPGTGEIRVRRSPSASRPRRHGRLTPARSRHSKRSWQRYGRERSPQTSTGSHAPRSTSPITRVTGSGPGWHEEPRLVPHATVRLEPDMVLAIEPGSYAGIGVRVEQVVLVNDAGCEVLSTHSLAL